VNKSQGFRVRVQARSRLLISGEKMYCVLFATHPCPQVPTEGFWSLLHRPMSLLPVFWQSTWAHRGGGKVYAGKLSLANLGKGCKTIHVIQQIVRDLCSCSMFLWCDDSVSWRSNAFRSCRHNIAFPYQVKT